MKKLTHSLAFKIIVGIIVVLAIYAAILFVSGNSVYTKLTDAQNQFDLATQSAENGKFDEALTATHQISADLQAVNTEMSGWQWNIARMLPVLGDDVRCAQGLALIGDELANEALIPVLTNAQKVGDAVLNLLPDTAKSNDTSTSSTQKSSATASSSAASASEETVEDSNPMLDFAKSLLNGGVTTQDLENALSGLSDLTKSMGQARNVISRCRMSAEALPEAHTPQLQELRNSLTEEIVSVDTVLEEIDGIMEFLGMDTGSAQGTQTTQSTTSQNN